ncbi:unnamed protein product [Paramecium sonneborni]|uniref:VWFA domain-containing protein n=1 Tax=Paramecium sonneborni TaxID=65129 RepID=A0A8S1R5W8_9CILI|nr:unnamed protein product [Paramecium sonneborni]
MKNNKGSRSISSSDSSYQKQCDNYFNQGQIKSFQQKKVYNIEMNLKEAQSLEDQVCENKVDAMEQEQIDIDAKKEEYKNSIKLNIFARQHNIQLDEQSQIMPVVIQLQSIKEQKTFNRANIDLICVVDVSGSMEGEKIKLVQNSLRYIQKILKPEDRIALVSFASSAYVNLAWTRNLPENKKKIKKAIKSMKIRDSTKIADGFDLGVRMIRDRKYKNQITNMFILSDGVDDDKGADQRCKQVIYSSKIKDPFTINTFGYGNDHDPKVLNHISNLKGGQFFYIDNIQTLSERFILAMSGMLSIKAQNAMLNIKQLNQNFKIFKIFGDDYFWQKINDSEYQLNLNYIIEEDNKELALEIEIPSQNQFDIQQVDVLQVELQGLLIEINTEFLKQSQLTLQLSKQQVSAEPNELVEVNYLRAKAGDIIGQAKELANYRKFDQAQQLLNKMIDQIEESFFKNNNQLLLVVKDLTKIKAICQPQKYQKGGEALMLHKQKKHIKRQRSISNSEEWCSQEKFQMKQFRNGDLELSQSNDSDSLSFSSKSKSQSISSASQSPQRSHKNHNKLRKRNRNRSRSSDSGSQRRIQQNRNRSSDSGSQRRIKQNRNRSSDSGSLRRIQQNRNRSSDSGSQRRIQQNRNKHSKSRFNYRRSKFSRSNSNSKKFKRNRSRS